MRQNELLYKAFTYNLIVIAVSAFLALFIFLDRGQEVAFGIALGGATMSWGMSMLIKQSKTLSPSSQKYNKRMIFNYVIRYLVYGIVLFVSMYYRENIEFWGTVYGLLTFKIVLYLTSVFEKRS